MKKSSIFFEEDGDAVTDIQKSCFGVLVRFLGLTSAVLVILILSIRI